MSKLTEILEDITGYKIQPVTKSDKPVIDSIKKVAKETLGKPMDTNRTVDLRGIAFEKLVIDRLGEELGVKSEITRVSGYPDGKFEVKGITYYVEVKVVTIEKPYQSFRKFALSSFKNTQKMIDRDGRHILIALLKDKESTTVTEFKVFDIQNLNMQLALEYQALPDIDVYDGVTEI